MGQADQNQLVPQLHASPHQVVVVTTGGGSGLIAALLEVPGASRTVLEALVPYQVTALWQFLGHRPDQACSLPTACRMAQRAWQRAAELAAGDAPLLGLAVTASLATDRPKRGSHRCHIAIADGLAVDWLSVTLAKGSRHRHTEEELVATAALYELARSCGVSAPDVQTLLGPADRLRRGHQPRSDPLGRLLAGQLKRVTVLPDGQCTDQAPVPAAVLPGSFNPLHEGHRRLKDTAQQVLGRPVAFELSVVNVDKPSLQPAQLQRRLAQFAWQAQVEVTRAPTFSEKAELLPGTTFVLGSDTALRIVDPKYYGGSYRAMVAAVERLAALGCRFLVAGRADDQGRFITLADVPVPGPLRGLFDAIPETRFRVDLSSTQLRQCATGSDSA